VTEHDGTTLTVEAAESVVAARRALTAAKRQAQAAKQDLREPPADRIRAERAGQDQLAQEAHRLALDRLRAALCDLAAASPGGVDHEHAEDLTGGRKVQPTDILVRPRNTGMIVGDIQQLIEDTAGGERVRT
jgi:hypothetical protein